MKQWAARPAGVEHIPFKNPERKWELVMNKLRLAAMWYWTFSRLKMLLSKGALMGPEK
jgi:hypothetical protein